MRIGIGFDIHRLIASPEKSSISLGGIAIPCFFRVEAHSDGDVLLHSVVDACLGALALGDIGQWFPDNKEENKGRPSTDFIREVVKKVHAMGWVVNQVDSVILLEEPKLAPHSSEIRESLASLLQIELSSVSVKAKTMERLGDIGKRNAIAAQAVITLQKRS